MSKGEGSGRRFYRQKLVISPQAIKMGTKKCNCSYASRRKWKWFNKNISVSSLQTTLLVTKYSFHIISYILNFPNEQPPVSTGHSIWFMFWDLWWWQFSLSDPCIQPYPWFWNLKIKKKKNHAFCPLILPVHKLTDRDKVLLITPVWKMGGKKVYRNLWLMAFMESSYADIVKS